MSKRDYAPKVVKAVCKTGGKTVEQIREKYTGQGFTYRDFENMQRMLNAFDGLTVTFSLWDYDSGATYHLCGWEPKDDEAVMMGIYYAEQVHPMPQYKNNLDGFIADWKSGEYDPGCSFGFEPEEVQEIETISEEYKPIAAVSYSPGANHMQEAVRLVQRNKHRGPKESS